jgi:hypothetical protein
MHPPTLTAILLSLGLVAMAASRAAEPMRPQARPTNQIIVSPQGPRDGGDFGPHTAGTKTSGLREALVAAKERAMDVYLAGGNWTADATEPVVYHLHETLVVPWMQNFRLDSGHCVLNYTPSRGDAVVFDSQMSCSYRLGLIVSASDGAVVRMKPTTAGPDRFRVITSTEFTFNALVGGGGAWPGGEPYKNQLDPTRRWVGTGLALDASEGSIDANKITVLETVGCAVGLDLIGKVTRNTIEEINIHLCDLHLRIGSAEDARPAENRISAFFDCQGIATARGAQLFGSRNFLTLSSRPFPTGADLILEPTAHGNLIFVHSPYRLEDRSREGVNRVLGVEAAP